MEGKFVLALDVGTTTVRCHVLDECTTAQGIAQEQVELLYPEIGREEIDPEKLWTIILKVMRDALSKAGVGAHQVSGLGISTQRATFVTWHRRTGQPFHNFVTWKDVRADRLVRQWNDSLTMKGLRAGSRFLYAVTGMKRFLAGSVLRFMNTQHVPGLKEAVAAGEAMFGTVDTWLLHRLTSGRLHVTDISNASATGMYDPFTASWGAWALGLVRIPAAVLPEVWDTAADFGPIARDVLGAPVPVRCLMADQAASLFGLCCFKKGDVKLSMGTGTFLNLNTGDEPHASVAGIYPVVAWRIGDETVCVAEGASSDTGSLVQWAQNIGLINSVAECSDVARSVEDSDGVYFVPAFSGLQVPVKNFQASAGFIGLKQTTGKQHMTRAMLESVVFQVVHLYRTLQDEARCKPLSIRVDGGVSKNDFICQLLSDLIGVKVQRPASTEMSVLGAGFLAGLHSGVWKSKEDLVKLMKVADEFLPTEGVAARYEPLMAQWRAAVDRFVDWYPVPQ
ncbi:putative glycerol kinase 5 isoform X2 [Bacillus rossius redtenbacheri]|uniref:putative glycerol kinase 5 isoform X2 n=1 Tax=Bacillus rossius redtenbacheri TaxID=93214 RepID=UPI002FDEEB4F